MLTKTGTAQGAAETAIRQPEGGAGLVLLYADGLDALPPVFVLQNSIVVGREQVPGGLCVPLQSVSRVHARFSKHNETWVVSDLSSRNGTLVNGARTTRAALASGDQIRIGDAIFKFVSSGAESYLPFRIDHPAEHEMVGGLAIHRVIEIVRRVALTALSVLVLGETGTGKELVARAIHRASGRTGRLCAINCAAIPAGLIESELFGFKRGAFTGATHDRQGVVRAAHGGTLMLDEIGDMPADTQAKLLRVLESREVVPVGAIEGEKVDIRLVCATHRDLRQLVDSGVFRGDLFARLHGCVIDLPPLRERKEDVYPLAHHFVGAGGRAGASMTFQFLDALLAYDWPFNVRELEAAIRHAIAMAGGAALDVGHLPEAVIAGPRDRTGTKRRPSESEPAGERAAPPDGAPRAASPPVERLRSLLTKHRGNVAAVARELGKDRAQIHRWLRYAQIDPAQYRLRLVPTKLPTP